LSQGHCRAPPHPDPLRPQGRRGDMGRDCLPMCECHKRTNEREGNNHATITSG
jgi:hypothetical protein